MISEAAKKARSNYLREWRKRNPEKTKQYAEKHWERIAERLMQESEQKGGDHGEKETTKH